MPGSLSGICAGAKYATSLCGYFGWRGIRWTEERWRAVAVFSKSQLDLVWQAPTPAPVFGGLAAVPEGFSHSHERPSRLEYTNFRKNAVRRVGSDGEYGGARTVASHTTANSELTES